MDQKYRFDNDSAIKGLINKIYSGSATITDKAGMVKTALCWEKN